MLDNHDNETREDASAEVHRQAYNAAFDELGLNWQWDRATYARLPAPGPDGVRAYLHREQAHLLRAYDAEFLVNAIEHAKSRCYQAMGSSRSLAGRYNRSYADSRSRQTA